MSRGGGKVRKAATGRRRKRGEYMAADERRRKAMAEYYEAYREYAELDNVQYHIHIGITGRTLIEIYRGGSRGRRILHIVQEEEEGSEVPATVTAYEKATSQLLYMIKERRRRLEENRGREPEARHWA